MDVALPGVLPVCSLCSARIFSSADSSQGAQIRMGLSAAAAGNTGPAPVLFRRPGDCLPAKG